MGSVGYRGGVEFRFILFPSAKHDSRSGINSFEIIDNDTACGKLLGHVLQ